MFMYRCLLVGASAADLRPLRDVLRQARHLTIIAEELVEDAVLPAIRLHQPDVVFLMPEHLSNSGFALINWIHARFPAVKVVVVIARQNVDLFFAYAELGVDGFFFGDNLDELLERLDDIGAGRGGLDSRLVTQFARILEMPTGQVILRAVHTAARVRHDAVADRPRYSAPLPNTPMHQLRQRGLTPREAEIALMAGQGLQVSDIAEQRRVARGTVTVTLRRAEVKLKCSNVRELRSLLTREGLV